MKIYSFNAKSHVDDGWSELQIFVEVDGKSALYEFIFEWKGRDVDITPTPLWSEIGFVDGGLLDALYKHERWPEINRALCSTS